jgi:hypothetical protein
MEIRKYTAAENICSTWDLCTDSIYQKLEFLSHLEKYNPCNQRYYIGYDLNKVICGAVVYSLKMNLLTFWKRSLPVLISVIGIPASVDAAGIIGKDTECVKKLISYILKQEKGLILCLNFNEIDTIDKIVKMQTLPTLIFEKKNNTWDDFLQNIKHPYRRRILKAEHKIKHIEKRIEPCSFFTQEHYNQYLAIMMHTKTKLETLSFDFFYHLPNTYQLVSLYYGKDLLVWHISSSDAATYYFLFGGINYELRDKFDSYCNNLISIIKEGFDTPCNTINLGQTATVSKNRLGANIIPLKMFLYHSNSLIRWILYLLKKPLSYEIKEKSVAVYKNQRGLKVQKQY